MRWAIAMAAARSPPSVAAHDLLAGPGECRLIGVLEGLTVEIDLTVFIGKRSDIGIGLKVIRVHWNAEPFAEIDRDRYRELLRHHDGRTPLDVSRRNGIAIHDQKQNWPESSYHGIEPRPAFLRKS